MREALVHPLPPLRLAAASAALVAGDAFYCLAYTALLGHAEPPAESLSWAAVNVLPWFLAFDMAKRAPSLAGQAGALLLALVLSLAPSAAFSSEPLAFELVRRLPGLAATVSLLALVRLLARRESRTSAAAAAPAGLPLLPSQIDWVRAAGNYVELHGCGRTLLHRSPLGAVEAALAPHGFVRAHRSALVRRDRIARLRQGELLLADGTRLPVGKRYRAALVEILVPSSQ